MKKKKSLDEISEITAGQIQSKNIKNYSEATVVHLDSLKGGKRSLQTISEYKVNLNNLESNLNQQAGFSAEIKEVARTNADRAFQGNKNRIARTDDLGSVNDPYIDIQEVGRNGRGFGKGEQLKFVGKNGNDLAKKILSNKYKKYLDNGIPIKVPEDYYPDVKNYLQKRKEKLEIKIKTGEENPRLRQEINRIRKANALVEQGKLTKDEALFARKHPELSVVVDAGSIVHRAGMEGAKTGAKIAGGMSVLYHAVQVLNGKEDIDQALLAVSKTTVEASAVGYAVNAGSTVLTTVMKKSGSNIFASLSNSNLPSAIVQTVIQSFNALKAFFSGEITGEECIKRVGQEGLTITGSSAGTVIGQMLIPVPVIGGLIGSIVGAAASNFASEILLQGIERAEMAEREAERVCEECQQYISYMEKEKQHVRYIISQYLSTYEKVFEVNCKMKSDT